MAKSMYEIIKKQNGEAFAQGIRNFDSSIFDIPDLPQIVRHAGREVKELLPYLASLKPLNLEREADFSTGEDLFELAKKAGYTVIYADTLEKQNSIQHLFKKKEELCTFRDSSRFKHYHILHFVKEGAENLKREDFNGNECREDEYGTSVLSIQIAKEGGFIKICNRYNHTVPNPDNTFHSNPDFIIPGLTLAIEKFLSQSIGAMASPLANGFIQLNGMIYQTHTEVDNIYFGTDFYIKDNCPHVIHKDYQMIVDNFIIDFKENKIISFYKKDDLFSVFSEDNIIPLLEDEIKNGRLSMKKEGEQNAVYLDDRCILKAKNSVMTYLNLKTPKKPDNSIFCHHAEIEEIHLDNLVDFKHALISQCFFCCPKLRVLSLPKLTFLGNESILHLPQLEQLDLRSVQEVGSGCLNNLARIKEINLPNCEEIGCCSIVKNKMLQTVRIKKVGSLCEKAISYNPMLTTLEAPLLNQISTTALQENPSLNGVHICQPQKIKSANIQTQIDIKERCHE